MFLKEEDSFMLFTPVPLGKKTFPREVLRSDVKACLKAGPCGLGEKAVYLNSFFVDRRFYAAYSEISRVFKRVAMSKGGFTGKGMFSSIPYLVVQLRDGTEKQCNFKYEEQVDEFIIEFKKRCPGIPTVSREGERRLAEERAKEEARYLKTLSPEAEETLKELRTAKAYLEEHAEVPAHLSASAKQKRVMDQMNPYYRYAAIAIFMLAAGALAIGIVSVIRHQGYAMYFVLFGMAFMFYTMSSQILPTRRNNKRYADRVWQEAVAESRELNTQCPGYKVPDEYAHPATYDRMIRVIREGKAKTADEAWKVMTEELMAINSSVTVSQTEYDEITAIKPMFLIVRQESGSLIMDDYRS